MLSEDPPVVACHKHDNKLVCSHPLKGTHNDLKGYGPGFVDAETLRGTDWMATHAEIRDAECTGVVVVGAQRVGSNPSTGLLVQASFHSPHSTLGVQYHKPFDRCIIWPAKVYQKEQMGSPDSGLEPPVYKDWKDTCIV